MKPLNIFLRYLLSFFFISGSVGFAHSKNLSRNLILGGETLLLKKSEPIIAKNDSIGDKNGQALLAGRNPLPVFRTCITLVSNPNINQNFVQIRSFKTPGVNPSNINAPKSVCDEEQTVEYFDGLGRIRQTVKVMASPSFSDIVQPYVYDALGRQPVQYLPYAVSGNTGQYRGNALSPGLGQQAFYANAPAGVVVTDKPFSVALFEKNPLSRVVEQGASGAQWQPIENSQSGHTLKVEFDVNLNTDQVKKWILNSNGNGAFSGNYFEGELYKSILKNENWAPGDGKKGTSEEFKDFFGRVVMKRVWETDIKSISTYYIFDDYGNLRYVLPPGVNENSTGHPSGITSFTEGEGVFKNFIYGYHYDERNRKVERAVPGKGWENIVYNKLDQVVLTQNSRQRLTGQWIYFKYDNLGRSIISGLYTSGNLRSAIQSSIDLETSLWENRISTGEGYSNESFPQNNTDYLTIKYYDDYLFPNNSFGGATGSQVSGERVRTLLTATKTKVLGTAMMLLTVNYYDIDGNLVQSKKKNHLGGEDVTDNSYSFSGELNSSNRSHNSSPNGALTNILSSFEYDHVGRKIASVQNINGEGEILISKTDYNEIGQLVSKKMHSTDGVQYTQQVGYSYNERSWIKGINDPENLSSDRIFGMTLNYANKADAYNGNIGSVSWKTKVPPGLGLSEPLQHFTYDYDPLNRLKKASYDSSTQQSDRFNEELTYDVMGSIQTLKRNNGTAGTPLRNDLVYNYVENGEQTGSLISVSDAGSAGQSGSYSYDVVGNQISNSRSAITAIDYNYLNLPVSVVRGSTGEAVYYTYDANGTKLSKTFGSHVINYVNGIQYDGQNIDFIQNEEGRAINLSGYVYEYFLKDHLGNTRAAVRGDGSITQVQDYYAFGMAMDPGNMFSSSPQNNYTYNGKENQPELGLNQLDYGQRFYDPLIGRWNNIDPLAEYYYNQNAYNYGANNPLFFVDEDGQFINTMVGAVIGAFIGGALEAAKHSFNTSSKGFWGDVGSGAFKGALAGALGGAVVDFTVATFGTGPVAMAAGGFAAGVASSVASQVLDQGSVTLGQTAIAGAVGGIFGYAGSKLAPAAGKLAQGAETVVENEVANSVASFTEKAVNTFGKSGDDVSAAGGKYFYRTMSHAEFDALNKNQGLSSMAGKELFVSTQESYSRKYLGKAGYDVLVKFDTNPNTLNSLAQKGLRDESNVVLKAGFGHLDHVSTVKGWMPEGFSYFKGEKGVLNIGLGDPSVFNFNIISFMKIP